MEDTETRCRSKEHRQILLRGAPVLTFENEKQKWKSCINFAKSSKFVRSDPTSSCPSGRTRP